jgi:peptide/nickel transport system permease protein
MKLIEGKARDTFHEQGNAFLQLTVSRRPSILSRLFHSPAGVVGAVIVTLVVAVAILAPWISPYDPGKQNIRQRLTPPAWVVGGSPEYLLGTDGLGRDILSRTIYGSRISLIVGLLATLVSGGIGVFLGLVAGYYRGRVDGLISRVCDVQQAIPFLVLAIAVVAMLGSGLLNLIIVLAITTWINYFRIVRGEVLSVREEQYVWAARSVGCSNVRIILRHVLPNVTASIIVVSTLLVANMIIFEASLSFLGLGVPPSIPTWGRIVSNGREYVTSAWWISLFPGLAILLTVMGMNLLGDWLRETLDPKGKVR